MKFQYFSDWDQLPHSVNALFSNAEKDSVFLSKEWFENLNKYVIDEKSALLIACVIENTAKNSSDNQNNKVLAIMPLLTNKNKEWKSFCHRYSSLYSILCDDKQQQEIIDCLCHGIKELPFDYLTLAPIAENDDKLISFQRKMESLGIDCYRNFHGHNWFHQTKRQCFAEYWAERPSKVTNTIGRKHRKLEREHKYEIQLIANQNIEDENETIEKTLVEYHAIYRSSWKATEQYEALIKEMAQHFAKRAWIRLAILTVDTKPIAAQLWFVTEGKANIFRLVYDEAWKQYSPGSILTKHLLEHVIDIDKVQEIDFLSGNDAYKKDWMSNRRQRYALVCVNKPSGETINKEKDESQNLLNKAFKLLFK